MPGLEAFSMVCNVMTVISFGLETAKLCRSIHESGSSDPELANHARRMRESSEQLLQLQLSATTDAEKRLQDVASECLQCTKDIEKEVIYLSPKKPGILRAMKSTIKTIRRRPHLDQLKARLETSRNTMNTVVIGQILEKCVESGKLNAGNFEALIRDQQAFQMAHEQRSQVVKDLMTQFHDRSKEIVITACKKIEDKIDVVQLRQDADKAYESLRHRKKIDDWDSDDLKNTLFEAFQATSRSYLVVLDGLDELSKPHTGMSELFELLDEMVAEDGVKLCISSRPERVFEERFSSGKLLRMQDLTFQDILKYTLATLNETTLETDDHLKDLIVNEIMQKSEGVFIWVYTVLENVKHGISEFNETWHDIYNRIRELPSDLMDLYRDMWSRLVGYEPF
ncbi:hypothetical protein K4K49_004759 [Colletotrichum sp. SAR 10_70]|nr:hypothetical protein K4K50_001431 [Colletotrichum sp. SAR 10_71]KAI8198049.1 hypothetical protein K4K49_004759 [Colletotrichum sp. SAR 10_70]